MSHQGLQVALEKPVAQRNDKQADDRNGQGHAGHGDDAIAGQHDKNTHQNGAFVVFRGIGEKTAQQSQSINAEIKPAVNITGLFFVQAVFGLQKEHEDGHHGVKAEPLTHVGKKSHNQTTRMCFEHSSSGIGYCLVCNLAFIQRIIKIFLAAASVIASGGTALTMAPALQ